jgi:DNA-binding transcriptional regulator YiaG
VSQIIRRPSANRDLVTIFRHYAWGICHQIGIRRENTKMRNRTTTGQEIVDGLHELAEMLKAGKPLESRFNVRTYKIPPPLQYGGPDVRRARELLAMSQAAFAAFLGVDPSTVRSWEQELRPPSPLACRLLSEIEADPVHWRKRLAACLVTSRQP